MSEEALRQNATSLILANNHPGGLAEPGLRECGLQITH